MKQKRYDYPTLNDIPVNEFDAIMLLLIDGDVAQADERFHALLDKTKAKPQYEVYHLADQMKHWARVFKRLEAKRSRSSNN